MKKKICLLSFVFISALTLSICLFASQAFASELTDVKVGDVNNDSVINISDARLCLRIAIRLDEAKEGSEAFVAADVSGDGTVTVDDARTTLRTAIGLEDLSAFHDWGDPDCKTPKICKTCGVRLTLNGPHKWNDGVVVVSPTNTKTGKRSYTCSVCNTFRKETLPMLIPTQDEWLMLSDILGKLNMNFESWYFMEHPEYPYLLLFGELGEYLNNRYGFAFEKLNDFSDPKGYAKKFATERPDLIAYKANAEVVDMYMINVLAVYPAHDIEADFPSLVSYYSDGFYYFFTRPSVVGYSYSFDVSKGVKDSGVTVLQSTRYTTENGKTFRSGQYKAYVELVEVSGHRFWKIHAFSCIENRIRGMWRCNIPFSGELTEQILRFFEFDDDEISFIKDEPLRYCEELIIYPMERQYIIPGEVNDEFRCALTEDRQQSMKLFTLYLNSIMEILFNNRVALDYVEPLRYAESPQEFREIYALLFGCDYQTLQQAFREEYALILDDIVGFHTGTFSIGDEYLSITLDELPADVGTMTGKYELSEDGLSLALKFSDMDPDVYVHSNY